MKKRFLKTSNKTCFRLSERSLKAAATLESLNPRTLEPLRDVVPYPPACKPYGLEAGLEAGTESLTPGTLHLNCSGQAMVEYLLATVLAALVIGAAFAIFFSALRGYYGLLTFLVGLPVP